MEHGKWFADCPLSSRVTHTEWCIPSLYFFYTFQNQIRKTVFEMKGECFKNSPTDKLRILDNIGLLNCVSVYADTTAHVPGFIVCHLWLWFIPMILKTEMNGECFKYSPTDKSGRQYIGQYVTYWHQQIWPLIYHDLMNCFGWYGGVFLTYFTKLYINQPRRVTLHLVWSVKGFSMNLTVSIY